MAKIVKIFDGVRYSFQECDICNENGVLKVVGRDCYNDLVFITLDAEHNIINVI